MGHTELHALFHDHSQQANLQARYWDLSSGEQLCRLDGHTDYVRAASPSPASQSVWATGTLFLRVQNRSC